MVTRSNISLADELVSEYPGYLRIVRIFKKLVLGWFFIQNCDHLQFWCAASALGWDRQIVVCGCSGGGTQRVDALHGAVCQNAWFQVGQCGGISLGILVVFFRDYLQISS